MRIRIKNTDTFVSLEDYSGQVENHPILSDFPDVYELTSDEPTELSSFFNCTYKGDPKRQWEYYQKRIADGVSYISIKTQQMIDARDGGLITDAQFEYIDDKVKEVRNALVAGQWKSARRELIAIQSQLSPSFYLDLFTHINNYCIENY